jgi:hypothetical protein
MKKKITKDDLFKLELMKFIVDKRGFIIDYKPKGTKNCKDDKYWLYFVEDIKKKLIICLREDECILLSALLDFAVHKKLVEVNKVGVKKKPNPQ